MHGAQTSWWTFFCAGDGFSFDYAAIAPTPVPPTLLLFATDLGALGVLGPAQEEERRSLISFGVVGCCTSVRVFGKFPLKNQWRIHQRNFRQQIRVFGKFPLMSQWRIHQDQHLDLLRRKHQHLDLLCQNYLVFFVVRSSVCLARRC